MHWRRSETLKFTALGGTFGTTSSSLVFIFARVPNRARGAIANMTR